MENYVWFAQIERFGYTLQVIGRTEEECRKAIVDEYITAYKRQNNDIDPKKEYTIYLNAQNYPNHENFDEDDDIWEHAHYFETFLDELYIEKREFGKVEWA